MEELAITLMAGVRHGTEWYPYTKDLMEFERRKRRGMDIALIPQGMREIRTPLVVSEWERELRGHPDREYAEYILRGIREGFRIGFEYENHAHISASSNMKSASQNPEVIDRYIANEVRLGRVIGPLNGEQCPAIHVSRFGVIPKGHQLGKWRLIVDLSHPQGASVNDGIEKELCSLHYSSVEEAVRRVINLGPGTQMAKLDIESAYRIVPVHPQDRLLLGMRWKESLYVESALPFGLRSAPKIFNALADALQWFCGNHGVGEMEHYLDDFIIFGAAESAECENAMHQILDLFARLGVPIAREKTVGPSTAIKYLGIELDSVAGTLRLPREKLVRLQREIGRWTERKSCTKRDLLSLIGQLQHACCVVRPGRTFLRRMIGLSTTAKQLHHKIRLNKGFRSDLKWWSCFLPMWNGQGLFRATLGSSYGATLTSDASGSWGCGAYCSSGEWMQLKWPGSWSGIHITVKELLPIVVCVAIWGQQWRGLTVRCRCDNAAVVAIVNSSRSRDERVMHLMRSLFFFQACFNVTLRGEHIPGVDNGAADALSRDDHMSFLSQVPSAQRAPTQIPEVLLQALVTQQQDWTSASWTGLLRSFLTRV